MPHRPGTTTTIKHIAHYTGYSFSTVAKALANDAAIKPSTRKVIAEAAVRLNYYPNRLAQGLRRRKARTIGVVLNDLTNPFYAEIYKAIDTVARAKGYTMILSDSDFDQERERENISAMISQGVEGIIVSAVSEDLQNLEVLEAYGIKLVIVDCKPKRNNYSYVYVDHELAASEAVEHLVSNGHDRILLLNGPSKLSSSRQFERGYAKVLRSHGIAFDSRLVLNMHLTIDAGHKTIRDMLSIRHCRTTEKDPGVSRTLNDFTAIVALSDLLALGAYKAAIESGFKIPDDYSVVGYDNIFAAPFLSPPLTTVNQPKELTGKSSINLLFDLIEGKRTKPERLILRPELVIRQSVQSIRKLDSRSKTTSR